MIVDKEHHKSTVVQPQRMHDLICLTRLKITISQSAVTHQFDTMYLFGIRHGIRVSFYSYAVAWYWERITHSLKIEHEHAEAPELLCLAN